MKRQRINLAATLLIFCIALLTSCQSSTNDGFSYTLLPIEKGGKFGYIDHEGKWVINPQFKAAAPFSDGLAVVQSSDDKYGYIDKEGHYVINAQYVGATHFSEGLAMVVSENGYPTCIDKKGKVKFVLKEAEEVSNFQDGLALVKMGNKYGYINDDGKIVINAQFDIAHQFTDGIAPYGVKRTDDSTSYLWGFIDKDGKIVANAQFRHLGTLKEGKAYASTDGKKYGFVDKKGAYIINPQFDDANNFNEGLAAIKQGENWGYIDEKGKLVINPQFERGGIFSDGVAAVRSGKESWGYIDKKGKYTINPQFKGGECFHNGNALVASGDQIGIINKEGKFKANPQFDGAWGEYEGDFFPEYLPTNKGGVRTDFFDGTALSKLIIGDVVNGTGIRGLNSSTTYSTLKPKLSPETEPHAYTEKLIDYEDNKISEEINISMSEYTFEQNLQEYSAGYFTSNYDYIPGGYTTNPNNLLKSVEYSIRLLSWGKTKNKALKMANAIKDELIKQCGVSETANDKNSTERTRLVIPQVVTKNSSDDVSIIFLYGEKCQYMIITNKEENTIQLMAVFSTGTTYTPKGNEESTYKE